MSRWHSHNGFGRMRGSPRPASCPELQDPITSSCPERLAPPPAARLFWRFFLARGDARKQKARLRLPTASEAGLSVLPLQGSLAGTISRPCLQARSAAYPEKSIFFYLGRSMLRRAGICRGRDFTRSISGGGTLCSGPPHCRQFVISESCTRNHCPRAEQPEFKHCTVQPGKCCTVFLAVLLSAVKEGGRRFTTPKRRAL